MIPPIGTDGVGGLVSTRSSDRAQTTREDFLRILTTELTNQDPTAPMDNTAFLQQMVALEQVQSSAALTDSLKAFEGFLQLSAAGGMIGMFVQALDGDGAPLEGLVDKVVVQKGQVQVSVGGALVPFRNITEVQAPPLRR